MVHELGRKAIIPGYTAPPVLPTCDGRLRRGLFDGVESSHGYVDVSRCDIAMSQPGSRTSLKSILRIYRTPPCRNAGRRPRSCLLRSEPHVSSQVSDPQTPLATKFQYTLEILHGIDQAPRQ